MRKKKQLEFINLVRKYLIDKGWREYDNSDREFYIPFEYKKETKLIQYHIQMFVISSISYDYSLTIIANKIEYDFSKKKAKVTPLEAFNMVKEMLEE